MRRPADAPCPCWDTGCAAHFGHCCMTTKNTEARCHQAEGMALLPGP